MREPELVRIRFQLGATLRFAGIVGADMAASVLGAKSIACVAADAIVRAPNAGRAISPETATGANELRVRVGPPGDVLSLVIADSPEPLATVFVLHGIRDSKEAMRGWAQVLVRARYRVVLVDLRGHGRSTGQALTYGVRESRDLAQAIDAIEARGLVTGSVGAIGFSYGAAVAIQWAALDPRVRAVVAVAPFASLREVVAGYLPLRLPASFLMRVVDLAGERAGFDPDAASPLEAIARTRAAVLLIHGKLDERIPAAHSQRIYAARGGHAELVLVDGARHKSVVTHPDTAFARRASAWFDAHLG